MYGTGRAGTLMTHTIVNGRTIYLVSIQSPPMLAINTTSVFVDFNHWNKVPEIVMQTADSWPKGQSVTITTSFLPDNNNNYYIAFDFAEISPEAENQSRSFSLALNGQTVTNNIFVANLAGGMYVALELYYYDFLLNSTGTMKLNPDATSQLGPILNALELFVLTDPAPNRTFLADGKPSPPYLHCRSSVEIELG